MLGKPDSTDKETNMRSTLPASDIKNEKRKSNLTSLKRVRGNNCYVVLVNNG